MSGKGRFSVASVDGKPKQYGLVIRKKTAKTTTVLRPVGFAALANKKGGKNRPKSGSKAGTQVASVFAAADADDSNDTSHKAINAAVVRQQSSKKRQNKVKKLHDEAQAQDANVFDYDAWAGSEGAQDGNVGRAGFRAKRSSKPKEAPKSKYIQEMLRKAQDRERLNARVYERRLRKEREEDEHLYGDKEKFVTSAYKRKLEEDRRAEEMERRRAAEEEDVTKRKDLSGFYANLLGGNVALGGRSRAVHTHAGAQVAGEDSEAPAGAKADKAGDGGGAQAGGGRGAGGGSSASAQRASVKRSRDTMESETTQNTGDSGAASSSSGGGGGGSGGAAGAGAGAVAAAASASDDDAVKKAAAKAAKAAAAKKRKEDLIKAARERFLARKNASKG